MANKKATSKKASSKKAMAKKSTSKKSFLKKAAPKKAGVKKLEEYGRPICISTHGYLGPCMPWAQAEKKAESHESSNHNCVADVESC